MNIDPSHLNSRLEIVYRDQPYVQLTAEEEAARLNEIPVINEKLRGALSLVPKPLASYLLQTTELTEQALDLAQTCKYRVDDIVVVRCRFDNDRTQGCNKDVVMSCPAIAKVANVIEVVREHLGADERFLNLKLCLEAKPRFPFDDTINLRTLADKVQGSSEVVFLVKAEPSDLWKESFSVEEVEKLVNGEDSEQKEDALNENNPSTSASIPTTQPDTAQQPNSTSEVEIKQEDGPGEGEAELEIDDDDVMPILDAEAPSEQPENVPRPIESFAPPATVPPDIAESHYMRPTPYQRPPAVHRPVQRVAPQQQPNSKSIDLTPYYTMFTIEDKQNILISRGRVEEIPDDPNTLNRLFSASVSPAEVVDYLRMEARRNQAQLDKMDASEETTPSFDRQRCKAQVDRFNKLSETFVDCITRAANPSPRKVQHRQRQSPQIRQNHSHPSPIQRNLAHSAIPGQIIKFGAPVSISSMNLVGMQAIGTMRLSQNKSKEEPNFNWNHSAIRKLTTADKEETIKAMEEYADWAKRNNTPAGQFLERYYTAAELKLENGTDYSEDISRRKCIMNGVQIPRLDASKQEAIFNAFQEFERKPERLYEIYDIIGWNESTQRRPLDITFQKTIRGNEPRGNSPTSSDGSLASNISSPESMNHI